MTDQVPADRFLANNIFPLWICAFSRLRRANVTDDQILRKLKQFVQDQTGQWYTPLQSVEDLANPGLLAQFCRLGSVQVLEYLHKLDIGGKRLEAVHFASIPLIEALLGSGNDSALPTLERLYPELAKLGIFGADQGGERLLEYCVRADMLDSFIALMRLHGTVDRAMLRHILKYIVDQRVSETYLVVLVDRCGVDAVIAELKQNKCELVHAISKACPAYMDIIAALFSDRDWADNVIPTFEGALSYEKIVALKAVPVPRDVVVQIPPGVTQMRITFS